MFNEAKNVLFTIYEVAKETKDGYVVSVDISLRSEDRKRVCDYLMKEGYITDVNYHGKSKISCQLEQRGYAFFKRCSFDD